MATITFKDQEAYFEKLRMLDAAFRKDESIKKAVYVGAGMVADAIRASLEALPEDNFARLRPGEAFLGISPQQKEDLAASFGLSKMMRDKKGFVYAKAGFDGYGRFKTKTYPKGLPNALLARSIEKGSSVRLRRPFIEKATRSATDEAVKAMDEVIENEIKKIF